MKRVVLLAGIIFLSINLYGLQARNYYVKTKGSDAAAARTGRPRGTRSVMRPGDRCAEYLVRCQVRVRQL